MFKFEDIETVILAMVLLYLITELIKLVRVNLFTFHMLLSNDKCLHYFLFALLLSFKKFVLVHFFADFTNVKLVPTHKNGKLLC